MKKLLILSLLICILSLPVLAGMAGTSRAESGQVQEVSTFSVVVDLDPGKNPEAAIESQLVLAEMLVYFQQQGSVSSFTPYYGLNQITVQGTPGARAFLDDLPGISVVDAAIKPDQLEAQPNIEKIDSVGGTGAITGLVTDSVNTQPIANIKATLWAYTSFGYLPIKEFITTSNGVYQFTELAASSNYVIQFTDTLGGYVQQYYKNKYTLSDADKVNVDEGQTTPGINVEMQPAGNISGTVYKLTNGQPISDIVVNDYQYIDGKWLLLKFTVTNGSGVYTLNSLPVGNHRVRFSDSYEIPRYLTEYYDNHDLIQMATDVPVTARNTTPNINSWMGGYGSITGAVTGPGGTPPISNIQVDVWGEILTQWTQEISGTTTTASNGTYTSSFLGTRNYRLRFSDPYGMYLTEYFNNQTSFDLAERVHVELGSPTPGKNIELALNPNAPITQNFGTGWYLVGWPVTPANTAPSSVFAPIAGTLDIAWDYDQCGSTDWTFYNPDISGNTLTAIAPSEGYWVKHTGSASLTVQGQYSASTSINLCTGWNLIGYPAARPKPVTEVLAPINGKYTLVYGYDGSNPADPWEKYDPAAPVGNDLTTFKPGRAYWINMNQDATLVIPGR